MIDGHRAALNARHAQLETRIASEAHRPVPDTVALGQLKKEKLRLKDELSTGRR